MAMAPLGWGSSSAFDGREHEREIGVASMIRLRGVRGAITCDEDRETDIFCATEELLTTMCRANEMDSEDVAALFFSLTSDLTAAVPAAAARAIGFAQVPMMDLQEAQGSPEVSRCIRVLALWNTERTAAEVRHVYLRGATALRPDWAVISPWL